MCPSTMANGFDALNPVDNLVKMATGTYIGFHGYLSYGINLDITGRVSGNLSDKCWQEGTDVPKSGYGKGQRLRGRLESVYQPSGVAMFTDAGGDGTGRGWKNTSLNSGGNPTIGPLLEHMDVHNAASLDGGDRLPFRRHRGGGVNVAYMDNHCAFAKRVKIEPKVQDQKDFAYLPSTRISPYKPGIYPQ